MAQQTTYAQNRAKDPRSSYYVPPTSTVSSPAITPPSQGAKPNQDAINQMYASKINQLFGSKPNPYSHMAQNAPANIYGGAEEHAPVNVTGAMQRNAGTVQGPNIQSDIPITYSGEDKDTQLANLALLGQSPDRQVTPQGPDANQVINDLATQPAPAPLPVTKPQPLTKDDTHFTQPAVDQAKSTVSNIIKSTIPADGVAGATAQASHDKVMNDIQQVAEAKDPHAAWKELQKKPFYQDSSWYAGLMGVGLAMMSGKDPLEAYQIGKSMQDDDAMKQQLQMNRDNLIDQGYSPDSVANAIAKGDPKLLTMKQMSDEQKLKASEEQYKEHQQMEMDQWKQQNDITSSQANQRLKDQFANEKELARIKAETAQAILKQKNDAKAASTNAVNDQFGGITPRAWDYATKDVRKRVNTMSTRAGQYQTAEQLLDRVQTLNDQGKYKEAGDVWNQGQEWMARGIMGKDGMLDKERINELTGFRDKLSSMISNGQLNLGVGPGKEYINRMKTILQADKDANDALVRSNYKSVYKSFRDGNMSHKNAVIATNKAFSAYPGFNPDDMGIVDPDQQGLSGGVLSGQSDPTDAAVQALLQ